MGRNFIECETRGGFHTSFGRGDLLRLRSGQALHPVIRKMRDFVPVRKLVWGKITSPFGRGDAATHVWRARVRAFGSGAMRPTLRLNQQF